MPAQEYVQLLRGKQLVVNSKAQRSLVPGAYKETTDDLIDNDRVLKQPRMKSFTKFVNRVMDQVEAGVVDDGFFGSVSFVLPEACSGQGTLGIRVDAQPSRCCEDRGVPGHGHDGESVFHIPDGQGRIVGFHAIERGVASRRGEAEVGCDQEDRNVKEQSAGDAEDGACPDRGGAGAGPQVPLSENDLSFICYAREVKADNTVVGLGEDAEKRCYIEGNALNSQASKEDMLKYEQFSPIVVDLQSYRDEHDWMSAEYIEEDSKSISASSPGNCSRSPLSCRLIAGLW